MRLSKVYSNRRETFEPVTFGPGLNVIMAEVRLPENQEKDTHNLGKTTFGRVLDFCFLAKKDNRSFLYKRKGVFDEFIFFLELQLNDEEYLTIRRGVATASKISFHRHSEGQKDFSKNPPVEWDHENLPFDRAKSLLDGMLGWRGLQPWAFRHMLGYLLRSQGDFTDVFQLNKHKGKHADWKPFLANILGFDGVLVSKQYVAEQELEKKREVQKTVELELHGSVADLPNIEGILSLKQDEAEKKQEHLDAFDFRAEDKACAEKIVYEVDGVIASLNAERYSLEYNKRKIESSLSEDKIMFDPAEAAKVFEEAGVIFPDQIKRDFQRLIEFNRAITDERRGYLREELGDIRSRLASVSDELHELGGKRSKALAFLSEADVFGKYKALSKEMIHLRAEIELLEMQRGQLQRLQQLRKEIRSLEDYLLSVREEVEVNVEGESLAESKGIFSAVRKHFSEIVDEVIDRKALLSVYINSEGHLDFKAEILDQSGRSTSADDGHTYKKLLCIAFDLAVLRAHLGERFPRFVYHDGFFETLDDRKKEKLLSVIRKYAELGLQSIVTLIDSDIPAREDDAEPVFSHEEIVLTLHDEGDDGRLFRMKPW